MQHLNTFLVCLDSTAIDEQLIKYSSMFAEIAECKKVFFVHIAQKNLSGKIKQFFEEKIAEHFTASCETEVQIQQGSNAVQVLSWTGLEGIDMILLGIKSKKESSGVHAAEIINSAKCSVLLVPRTAEVKLEKVILPLDFSGTSLPALEFAKGINAKNGAEVFLHHVYFVPTGYTHTGKTYDEMAEIMKKNKLREYEQFKREHKIDDAKTELIFELDDDENPSDNICEMAKERNVDLIMVASRGRTRLASMLKHSTAASLINYDRDLACLVVKEKKSNMGFFEALMKL